MVSAKSVKEILFEEPYRFEFFQAVRLFERLFPEKKTVGKESLPAEEPVRFRSYVTLTFPSSEIQEIREITNEKNDETRMEMLVNFMGLVGASGVLPVHYTELVFDRIRHHDSAMWAFFDIFTHRAVSLHFRAWEKYRFPVAYERGNDEFTSYLFDFAGLGTDKIRGKMGFDDESLLPYVGLIAQKPHSSSAIENVLSDYFRVPVKIEQLFGLWLDLAESDLTRVGRARSTLGSTVILGKRIWDQQSKFRIRLGPMDFAKFQAFLPNGTASRALRSLVNFMAGIESDFDLQLALKAKQVPSLVLTTRAMRRPMLGWTTWLKTKPFVSNDEQVVLSMN
jgi:type VI secretion system protein ImpH